MRILHCADWHLDSPMETHMSSQQATIRNTEILKTFQRMTEYAKREKIRLVLIAGDLFDGERVTRRTAENVLDSIRRYPEIGYLYVSGNHDNCTSVFEDMELPENLFCFTDRWETLSYDEVSISSIEITKSNAVTLYEQLPEQTARVNIVMLHGMTSTASGVDQVNLNLLKAKNIQYLALGHIHKYSCESLDRTGLYCYPGCPEGRGFDECGVKGFVVLDTDMRVLSPTFVPFAQRQLHRISVDVTGLKNNQSVYNKMKEQTSDISQSDMVEFVLTGAQDPSATIALKYLNRLVENDFFFSKVKDETRLVMNPKDYENDISLKGEFIRLVLNMEADEKTKSEIIRSGLEALAGEEITV